VGLLPGKTRGEKPVIGGLLGLAAGVVLLATAGQARAEPMDPAIDRLVLDPNCRTSTGAYNTSNLAGLEAGPGRRRWCAPDNVAFKKLINQYGFALAPTAMHSARTTGFGGFHLSIEGAFTDISQGRQYWKRGTQGAFDDTAKRYSVQNKNPDTALQLYSLKIRKSFGFGLELTGAVGFMPKSNIIAGGADARLSLLEGFREGIPGVIPDVAVGGGVRTITGTPQFQLTVAGLDAQISKPLPLADSSVITPWVGYQYVWIFGDSGLVDLTPGTDPVGYCNFAGQNVPGNRDPSKTTADGQPICPGGSPLDFNNNVVFQKVRLERQRLLFGLNYRYEMVMLGVQFITDIVDPADAQNDEQDKKDLEGEDRQWTLVVELGAMF
jgi:hypothetical protein